MLIRNDNEQVVIPAWLKSPKGMLAFGLLIILLIKIAMGRYQAQIAISQTMIIAGSTFAGFALGWFLSPQARALRAAVGVALLLVAALFCLGDFGVPGITFTSIASWVGFVFALGYWLGQAASGFGKYLFEPPTTFGSAKWATYLYLLTNGLIGTNGIRLGLFPSPDGGLQPVHYEGDRHVLVIAPTGSGKGTTAIIPNLLTYGDAESGSILVIDPKGENALITADQRRRMGQTVHIVDPWGIASNGKAARFNPIDWLNPNDPDLTENAMILADALVMPKSGGHDPFWSEESKALLGGLILYVATEPLEEGQRHLPRVRDLLLGDGDDLKLLWQRMLDSKHHVVASTGARCLQKEERLMSNVIASAQSETLFLDAPRLRHSLMASDFTFEDLKTRGTSIYLVLPSDRLTTFSRWLRLLIQQAITVSARNIAVTPKQPVLFVLDEMPALGKLSSVETGFRLLRGYGIQFFAICQDASQLAEIYGKSWEGFIANSGVVAYHGSLDRMTASYCSALCGEATVLNFSTAVARALSFSSGSSGGKTNHSSSDSSTTTETSSASQRKLAYPDELMRLPKDRQLVFIEHHDPIIGIKQNWFDDPELRTKGVNLREIAPPPPPPAAPSPVAPAFPTRATVRTTFSTNKLSPF
jgi:type IV secretion system protein VirD4